MTEYRDFITRTVNVGDASRGFGPVKIRSLSQETAEAAERADLAGDQVELVRLVLSEAMLRPPFSVEFTDRVSEDDTDTLLDAVKLLTHEGLKTGLAR